MNMPAPPKDAPAAARYSAPALEKGLDILELLASRAEPLAIKAIAEALGRSKAEIFRMCGVLLQRGYLARDSASDGLVLTNRLFDLGMRSPPARDLVSVALPRMQALAAEIGHSVHLVVVHRSETVVVAIAEGGLDLRFSMRLGYRRPILDAASGLVTLAFQPEQRRLAMLAACPGVDDVAATASRLEPELARIRAQGRLIRPSTASCGVTDIVCPILGADGNALACLTVPVVASLVAPTDHDVAAALMMEAAEAIRAAR